MVISTERKNTKPFPKEKISLPSEIFTYEGYKDSTTTMMSRKISDDVLASLEECNKNLVQNKEKTIEIKDNIILFQELSDAAKPIIEKANKEESLTEKEKDRIFEVQLQQDKLNQMRAELIKLKQELTPLLKKVRDAINVFTSHKVIQAEFPELIKELNALFEDLTKSQEVFINHPESYNEAQAEEEIKKISLLQKEFNKINIKTKDVIEETQNVVNKVDDFRKNLLEEIREKIQLAQSEVYIEWQKVKDPNLENALEGKKNELIKYLKLLYFKDENFNVQDDKVFENKELAKYLKKEPDILQVVLSIRQLELEANPEAFKELISNFILNNIADRAIKKYLEESRSIDRMIKILVEARNEFLKDINDATDNKRKAQIIKEFKKKYLDNQLLPSRSVVNDKSKFLQSITRENQYKQLYVNMVASRLALHIDYKSEEYKLLTERISREYDRLMQLNDADDFICNLDNKEIISTAKNNIAETKMETLRESLINKYLLDVDPEENYNKVLVENMNPAVALTVQAVMQEEFRKYGVSINTDYYLDKLEQEQWIFSRRKVCYDKDGERVTLRNLIETQDVLIRQEANKNQDIYHVLIQNKIEVPLDVLERCFSGPDKVISIMNHNREGELFSVIKIITKVVKDEPSVTVYELEKASYLTGTEMQLDSIKKPNVRVGLTMKVEEYQETNNEIVDGKVVEKILDKTREVYSLVIFSDELPLTNKEKKLIEDRYGDRIFKGPDGKEITVAKLLAGGKVVQRNARKKGRTESIEDHKNQKIIDDTKESFRGLVGDVKGLPVIRNIDRVLKERKSAQEKEEQAEKARLEKLKNDYTEVLDFLVQSLATDEDEEITELNNRKNRNPKVQVIGRNLKAEDADQILFDNNGDLDLAGQMLNIKNNIQEISKSSNKLDDIQDIKLSEQIQGKIIDISRTLQDLPRAERLGNSGNLTILENQYIQPSATNSPILLQLIKLALGKSLQGFYENDQLDSIAISMRRLIKLNLELGIIKDIIQNPKDHNVGKDLQGYLDKTLTREMKYLQEKFDRQQSSSPDRQNPRRYYGGRQ